MREVGLTFHKSNRDRNKWRKLKIPNIFLQFKSIHDFFLYFV